MKYLKIFEDYKTVGHLYFEEDLTTFLKTELNLGKIGTSYYGAIYPGRFRPVRRDDPHPDPEAAIIGRTRDQFGNTSTIWIRFREREKCEDFVTAFPAFFDNDFTVHERYGIKISVDKKRSLKNHVDIYRDQIEDIILELRDEDRFDVKIKPGYILDGYGTLRFNQISDDHYQEETALEIEFNPRSVDRDDYEDDNDYNDVLKQIDYGLSEMDVKRKEMAVQKRLIKHIKTAIRRIQGMGLKVILVLHNNFFHGNVYNFDITVVCNKDPKFDLIKKLDV